MSELNTNRELRALRTPAYWNLEDLKGIET